MASPLATKSYAALNAPIPASPRINFAQPNHESAMRSPDDTQSSPFMANMPDNENQVSHSLDPLSPTPKSPGGHSSLKMLKIRPSGDHVERPRDQSSRRLSTREKRFPIKISASAENRPAPVPEPAPSPERPQENGTLERAMQIAHQEYSEIDYEDTDAKFDEPNGESNDGGEGNSFADDTAFSNFSAVPDMTMFAKIGHTPSKFAQSKMSSAYTPATLRRPNTFSSTSPTPRRHVPDNFNDTTNLLDFTEQFTNFGASSRRLNSQSQDHTVSNLYNTLQSARTPSPSKFQSHHQTSSRMSNLLDFDIPPAPTPRSMPSITPRELESLKSAMMSEISSLKASLSGKEAEVMSLKNAIGDAEKRVGESFEQLRELEAEKDTWMRRQHDMEQILHSVKEEFMHSERERENLEGRLNESEQRREAAEMMAQEAESKMAAMRAAGGSTGESGSGPKSPTPPSSREIEIAVEKVARELHTLYKGKHETKVQALKTSYQNKWERKVRELENKVDELAGENNELRTGRDATMTGVIPRAQDLEMMEELRSQAARDAQNAKELEARLEGLLQEVQSIKNDNASIRQELEQERVEKGELVAACDELLALQETQQTPAPKVAAQSNGDAGFRTSISRPSGLRAPNFSNLPSKIGESRIGRTAPAADKSRSGSSQSSRPGSGLARYQS